MEDKSESILVTNEDPNKQIYIAIEKYIMLLMIEFKEHIGKYQNIYSNVKHIKFIRYVQIHIIILFCLKK